jgi:lambda family phage portal protein
MKQVPDQPQPQVRMTFIDRIVAAVDPNRGLQRLQARSQLDAAGGGAGGYNGGRRDRRALKRWKPAEGSADADTLQDLPDLRARSRDLSRNAPIATGAILTNITNVVGAGIQLMASIDAEALGVTPEQADAMEREQEREWDVFCATCDFTGVQCMDEYAATTYRAELESGDCFIIRRFRLDPGDVYGTKLQMIEADRVSNPNRGADSDTVAGGVEIDKDGRHVAYHVTNKHPGGLRPTGIEWERVPARDSAGRQLVLHQFNRTRPELTRGAPYLAPVVEYLKQLATYSDAEVNAAVVSSMVSLIVETAADEDGESGPIIGETDASLNDNEVKLGSGAVISLAPGEKATSFNPSRPNEKFDPFVQAFCRQIGVALELPFELLLKHFTSSYSASRASLEMAWQTFRMRRAGVARRLLQPAYEWMMEEAVASGRLNRPGFFADPIIRKAYCGAEWIGPQRASLNPKQESDADANDVENGFKTIEQVCIERTGGEFEKKNAQRAKEVKLRTDAGLDRPAPAAVVAPTAPEPEADDPDEDKPEGPVK